MRLFYGWIFAYEVKTILGAVEAGDARQLHTGMAEKAVEYIFGLIYLIFVLAAAVIYGITISIITVFIGVAASGAMVFFRFSNVGTILPGGVVGGILIYFQKITSSDRMALLVILPAISGQLFQIPFKINEFSEIKGM